MSNPIFIINSILKSIKNKNNIREILFKKGILSKNYGNMILLYRKYDSMITNELERECRSLVIDYNTLNIIAYSCEFPRLNTEGYNYLVSLKLNEINNITENSNTINNICYEGAYFTVFYYNDDWYISSHTDLYSRNETNIKSMNHKLFFDIIDSDFYEKLDKNKIYNFILLHYKNKKIIDYSELFGDSEYKKLCLTCVRDLYMKEEDIYSESINICEYIFTPEKDKTISDILNTPHLEGVIIKIWKQK